MMDNTSIEDALTEFIEKREGMNYSDAQDFAFEILNLLDSLNDAR